MLATWIGGTGDWSDSADWSTGAVPGSTEDVTIPAGSNVSISKGESAGTLTTAAGSTLTLGSNAEDPFSFSLSGGGTINGMFNWTGTLDGSSAVLTCAGTTVVTGSTDGGDFANTGNMTFNGGGIYQSNFTNSGAVTVTGGVLLGGGTITNSPGATFTITDDSSFAPSTYIGTTSGTFINEGTFTKSGGTGTSLFPLYTDPSDDYGGEFENLGGTINIDSGNFTVHSTAALQGGQINVAAGSTFNFLCADTSGTFNVTLAGLLTGSGGGTISLAQGNYFPQAPGEVAADATLDFPSGMVQIGDATFAGDSNTLTNSGFLNFTSSTGNGAINMVNQGTITNSGSSDLPIQDFVNETTGILDLETDAGLANGGGIGLTNKGVIRKSAGTGVSALTTPFFNDGGSLDIESGSLAFQEHNFGYIAGPIFIATGSQLDFQTSNGVYVQGALSSTGGGTVTMSSGWFDGPDSSFSENANATGSLDFAPGKLTFDGGFSDDSVGMQFENIGTVDFAATGGPLGTMYNAGTINFAGGEFDVEKGSGLNNLAGGVINFNAATDLVTEAINCRIDNQGLIVVNAGSSTMDLATPYPFDQYTAAPAITNDGTFEVASGTLIYPSVSLDSNGTIPAGAEYKVDAGATLTTEPPAPVTTNDGTVILQGLGAEFPALAPLATNSGTFGVGSGAEFATAGNLTNTGTLSVGGSLTVNGNLTQSATSTTTPVLDFPVAAAVNSIAAPKLTVTGTTTLAGKLTAEFSNGFAAASGSVYKVASFASSATGAFASTAGVGPDFTVAVNPTSIVLNSSGAGAADLAVTSVSAPATFTPGQSGPITWKVINDGATVGGEWTDSVYLSTNGTVNAGDLLLGRVVHTSGLASGASYTGSLTPTFPAAAGTYEVVVVIDSTLAVPDTNRATLVGASSPIVSSLPALTLGGSVTGTLSAGEDLLYTLNIPGGTDVRVSAVLQAPAITDLEISRGAVPSSGNAEFSVPLSTTSDTLAATIPQPEAGTYYILLQGQSGAGSGQSFTLSARTVAFGAFSVSPSTVGTGQVSLVINGAGFAAGSTVALLGSGGTVAATATSTTAINSNTLEAAFNLGNVATGTYSLRITVGIQSATMPSAITVQPAPSGLAPVQFSVDAPANARYGHVYDLLVNYTNPNNIDVPAPLFQLTQPNAEFELASGNIDAKIDPDTSFQEGAIELLAEDQEGLAGTLPPGYTGVYDVRFTAIQNISDSRLDILLNVVDPTSSFDASSLLVPGPDGLSEVSAEILAAQIDGLSALPITVRSGTDLYPVTPNLEVSSAALNSYLDSVATELSTGGLCMPDATWLITTAAESADQFGGVTARELAGPFGQGTHDLLLSEVVVPSSGSYVDVITPSGELEFLQSGTSYTAASPIDTDTLAKGADGTFRLTELDRSFYQFNANNLLAYYQSAGGLNTTYNYNENRELTSIVAPGNQTTTYTYNSSGLVISSTDPEGNITTYGYTMSGSVALLTSITTPAGTTTITYTSTPTFETQFGLSYESSSPALAYLPKSILLPDGTGENFTYDALGRLTKTTLLDGSDPTTETYDATGLQVTTTFADGGTETDLYGPGDIVLKTTEPDGNSASLIYGPNLLLSSLLAPGGAQSSFSYNSQSKLSAAGKPERRRGRFHLRFRRTGHRNHGRRRQHGHRGLQFQLQSGIPDLSRRHASAVWLQLGWRTGPGYQSRRHGDQFHAQFKRAAYRDGVFRRHVGLVYLRCPRRHAHEHRRGRNDHVQLQRRAADHQYRLSRRPVGQLRIQFQRVGDQGIGSKRRSRNIHV